LEGLDALVNRVYGKPKETLVSEKAEPEWKRQLDDFSTDALTRIIRKNNPEVIRQMEENGTIKRVDDMTTEERDDLLRALTFQPRLRRRRARREGRLGPAKLEAPNLASTSTIPRHTS
jgi:hypothetical protein